jgi:hypothetical protein
MLTYVKRSRGGEEMVTWRQEENKSVGECDMVTWGGGGGAEAGKTC